MDIPGEGTRLPRVKQQAAAIKWMEANSGQIPPKHGDKKAGPSNPTKGAPKEQVWVRNLEAPTRVNL